MFSVTVEFVTGKCYAAQADDPTQPEWPPHPSRLYSAFVAAAYGTAPTDVEGNRLLPDEERQALEWLEGAGTPHIDAPEAAPSPAPIVYVPPGDIREKKGKKGEEEYEHPVHRWLQPRSFPCAVILDEPRVSYIWDADPDSETLTTLKSIANEVTHVGTSHSMTLVTVGAETSEANWCPHPEGDAFFRTPLPGRLNELDAIHQGPSKKDKRAVWVRRPASACEPHVAYQRVLPTGSVFSSPFELLPLRLHGIIAAIDTGAALGRAVRRAVMSVLGDDAPAAVHGHDEFCKDHVGWVSLPDVGHPHARGRVIGIGLALPRSLSAEERQIIMGALARLSGIRLTDGRTVTLTQPPPGEQLPRALWRSTWTRDSDRWATVSPVVLDRPHKKMTPARAREGVAQSLVIAGYPEPVEIEVASGSIFDGVPSVFQFPTRKPRYHAVVRFSEPVAGPVLAGRLRFFGVGLWRPLRASRKADV